MNHDWWTDYTNTYGVKWIYHRDFSLPWFLRVEWKMRRLWLKWSLIIKTIANSEFLSIRFIKINRRGLVMVASIWCSLSMNLRIFWRENWFLLGLFESLLILANFALCFWISYLLCFSWIRWLNNINESTWVHIWILDGSLVDCYVWNVEMKTKQTGVLVGHEWLWRKWSFMKQFYWRRMTISSWWLKSSVSKSYVNNLLTYHFMDFDFSHDFIDIRSRCIYNLA